MFVDSGGLIILKQLKLTLLKEKALKVVILSVQLYINKSNVFI